MKTANLPFRPAIVLSLIAGLTVTAGLLPVSSTAQESQRTIATGSNIPLTADAPDEYAVKTGDTLWDISKVFLRDPWYWPEIWYVNPQVENPHLIYPGDVLKLVYIDGQPRVTLGDRGGATESGGGKRLSPQVRREPLSQAITAIPYDVIASFMGRPTLLDGDQVKSAPYVVAMRDGHVIGAVGNEIYARGIGSAAADARYSIIHVDEKIVRPGDPRPARLLGHVRRLRPGRDHRRSRQAPADRLDARGPAGRQAVPRIGRRERRLRAARARPPTWKRASSPCATTR